MILEGQCVCGHKRCVLTEGCATREASLTGCESAGQCDQGHDDRKSVTGRASRRPCFIRMLQPSYAQLREA
jgi:hypothetical protein